MCGGPWKTAPRSADLPIAVPAARDDFPARTNPESPRGVFRGTIDPWPMRFRP